MPAVVEPGYKVPRLKDGKPDISGVWSNASNTPMRRPGSSKNLVMTDDEAAKARASNPVRTFASRPTTTRKSRRPADRQGSGLGPRLQRILDRSGQRTMRT
jgi:hypothetical protein